MLQHINKELKWIRSWKKWLKPSCDTGPWKRSTISSFSQRCGCIGSRVRVATLQLGCRVRRDVGILEGPSAVYTPACVHHTAESNCTPWSQNRNLWESMVAIKGTIRRNPFRGEFFELCEGISRRNRNRIRKYLTLFIRGPDGCESWEKMKVENLVTHSL